MADPSLPPTPQNPRGSGLPVTPTSVGSQLPYYENGSAGPNQGAQLPQISAPGAGGVVNPAGGGAAAPSMTPFDPRNVNTWSTDVGQGQNDSFYQMSPSDRAKALSWGDAQDSINPWESRNAAAAQQRSNYYYGGSPGGADAFNGQVAQTQQGLGMGFGRVENTAGGIGQNAQALGASASQLQGNAAYLQGGSLAMQQGVNGRNPGQFLDQSSLVNNQNDRFQQQQAIGGLQQFTNNGPGPSAAQATLANATSANQANELALARSGRGLGQNQSNLHNAMNQGAQIQQQSANQSAILNAQEMQNYRANQLQAYNQIGNIAGQARAGDVSQGSYFTGSQQAGQSANDQTALGYGQQALGAGQLGVGAGQFGVQAGQLGLGAGQLQLGANTGNAQAQMAGLGLQNNVNSQALGANENYEQARTNQYLGITGQNTNKGTDYSPYLSAAGAVIGTAIAPGAGTAAGAAAGNAAGQAANSG